MRYFYMTCLILSSFFICNHSIAENITRQYAFFIPNNVYDKNTTVNSIDSIRPRYTLATQKGTNPKENTQKNNNRDKITLPFSRPPITGKIANDTEVSLKTNSIPQKDSSPSKTAPQPSPESNTNIITKESAPIEAKQIVHTADSYSSQPSSQTKSNTSKYNLDDDFLTDIKKAEAKIIKPQLPKEKTITERLAEIPFPDLEQPRYKQVFGNYGITLRTLYRQNEMPADYEQDEILAKANSIKRFLVK